MNPKEYEVLYGTIEHLAEHFYRLGQEDQAAGQTRKAEDFKLGRASKLTIKTKFEQALKPSVEKKPQPPKKTPRRR